VQLGEVVEDQPLRRDKLLVRRIDVGEKGVPVVVRDRVASPFEERIETLAGGSNEIGVPGNR
jgi:hypothetical protein